MSETNERPAALRFLTSDGKGLLFEARVPAEVEVFIGRTGSKRAMGFLISGGDQMMSFVLNKDQVAELAAYLNGFLPGLLEPRGRKPQQMSLVPARQHRSKRRAKREK